MVFVYVGSHAAPAPRAPESLTTIVAPGELDQAAVRDACAVSRPGSPLARARRFQLFYPDVPFDPNAALYQIRETYRNCERCHLADRRNAIVFFRGNPSASILCVGEGPGQTEDLQGLPFIGKSGKLMDELFREAGINPENDIAWTNIVGCRPCETRFSEERKPSIVESIACSERLLMTMRAVRPKIVLCLGEVATSIFYAPEEIPETNTFATFQAGSPPLSVTVGVLRHPAYLLRIGQQPNMYGEWAGMRLALRQVRAWLPTEKLPAWPFGLRYVSDLKTTMVGA